MSASRIIASKSDSHRICTANQTIAKFNGMWSHIAAYKDFAFVTNSDNKTGSLDP